MNMWTFSILIWHTTHVRSIRAWMNLSRWILIYLQLIINYGFWNYSAYLRCGKNIFFYLNFNRFFPFCELTLSNVLISMSTLPSLLQSIDWFAFIDLNALFTNVGNFIHSFFFCARDKLGLPMVGFAFHLWWQRGKNNQKKLC